MAREMLINVSEGEECRIALLEDGKLEEFYIERTSATSHVGNIYKGRVVNVEPSIQAAFIDFGMGRNGFLHISDLQPSYFGHKGEDITETVGRKLARRDRPPIQRCLRRGDDIIVQIIKEGIGTKGPTLTTYLSVPGRILVMMPGMSKMGVSRKIEDEDERKRLRQILDSLDPIEECGFIIRTAGVGKSKAEIQRDLAYLTRLWSQINKKMESCAAPVELYTEGDLVTRTVRDVFSSEIDAIIVDNEKVAERLRDYMRLTSPRTKDKVELYTDPLPIFHRYNIEKEIEMMYSRHVPLPSGGSLVIDQTEAVVAIDVNSGKFRDHSDAETTAFKTDMEAADEIPRQLKLRDLGGVIICDFIDLRYERHRRELERKLHDNFKNDRAKTKVLRMSQFGIIELTRQRMRPSVKRSIYYDCPYCRGSGLVKTPESMSLDVMRKLAIAAQDQRVVRIELTVHTDVANFLSNRKRRQLAELEAETGKRILIKTDLQKGLDEATFELFDSRDGVVMLPDLLAHAPQTIQEAQLMAVQARNHHGTERRRDGGRRRPQQEQRSRFETQDDRYELEEMDEHGDEERRHEEPAAESEEELASSSASAIESPDYDEQIDADQEIGEGPTEITDDEPSDEEVDEREPRGGYSRDERREDRRREQPRREEQPRSERPQFRPEQLRYVRPQEPGESQPAADRSSAPADREQQPVYRSERNESGGRGGFSDEGEGRGRRRGRRGRGRGRFEEQHEAPIQESPRMPPARSQEELLRRMPTNIWIQMPGEERGSEFVSEPQTPQSEPVQSVRPAQPVPPVRSESDVKPAPIAPDPEPVVRRGPSRVTPAPEPKIQTQPVPQAQVRQPAPVEAEVRPAPIAEWPEELTRIRRRTQSVTPAAPEPAKEEVAEAKPTKGKRTARKTVAPKKVKAAATTKAGAKSRSRKKAAAEDADVTVGADVDGSPVEEPKVRIADDVTETKAGDRHLATDEPVDPEAVRKVNTARDLDHVPEEE